MHRNKHRTKPEEDREFIDVFSKITDGKTMEKFFSEIFSPAEVQTFSLRWKLMKMLKAKIPQRNIASKLHISLCKITRGAKVLKNPDAVTNQYIQPYKTRRPNAR
jgi:TrpR family trp operon transcriptional repressor